MTADVDQFPELDKTRFEQRGTEFKLKIPVTNAVSIGNSIAVGFGDGTVRIFSSGQSSEPIKAHDGVVLCMSTDGNNILTGGDDGRFLKISLKGEINEITNFGSRWVDHVTAHNGNLVCSSGKVVYYWDKNKKVPKSLDHDSTIGGLAFDAKGRRLAVARYGGVTVWKKDYSNKWKSTKLDWKGSHNKVSFSPDGQYLVTSMQENQIHCWRLKDKIDFAMSGYGSKIKSFGFVGDSKYLATSGAIDAICWPFDGKDGPMGRSPVCVANNGKNMVSCVQALPGENAVFTGFKDGAVLLAELDESKSAIPIKGSTGREVTAIGITKSLSHLLIGDAKGQILWTPLWYGDNRE